MLRSKNGNIQKTVKHWTISANFEFNDSIKALKEAYEWEHVSKNDLVTTLRDIRLPLMLQRVHKGIYRVFISSRLTS
jgi:hypothetical protein